MHHIKYFRTKPNIFQLFILIFFTCSSCLSSSGNKKKFFDPVNKNRTYRIITAVSSAIVLGGIARSTSLSIDKGQYDENTAMFAGSSIGALGGHIASEYIFKDKIDNRNKTNFSNELARYREMDRNNGRYLISKDVLTHGPDRVSCPGTNKKVSVLCTSKKDGELNNCEDVGFMYLNSNWAVQFSAWYSPGGCYTGPYNNQIELKKFFKKFERSLK